MKKWLLITKRTIYWVLPVIILYLIFQKINPDELKTNFAKTNQWLVLLGIIYYPFVIGIGALRWHHLLRIYNKGKVSCQFTFMHYWIGLFLGFFVPASLGWDLYRIASAAKRYGNTVLNIAAILVEKFLALATCMCLIVFIYPFLSIESNILLSTIFQAASFIFIVTLATLFIINFSVRNKMMKRVVDRFESFFTVAAKHIVKRLPVNAVSSVSGFSIKEMMRPLTSIDKIVPIIFLSFGIQVLAAIGNQIFFIAIGYKLSFIVNLFVIPILFFIFLLPVSFGSIGVREGSYVLIYGMFGVPAEIALLVSFFNLLGVLLNNLVGGILLLPESWMRKNRIPS